MQHCTAHNTPIDGFIPMQYIIDGSILIGNTQGCVVQWRIDEKVRYFTIPQC
jgi:hypothetical protein